MARVHQLARGKFSWYAAFTAVPVYFYSFCPTRDSVLWRICVCTHTSDCVKIARELPLLPNNTANETLLHKSGAVRTVDCIFIIGASAWRWLGEYVPLDRTFYYLLLKQEVTAAPVTDTFCCLSHFSRTTLLDIYNNYTVLELYNIFIQYNRNIH